VRSTSRNDEPWFVDNNNPTAHEFDLWFTAGAAYEPPTEESQ
jgi:hypothetical protein